MRYNLNIQGFAGPIGYSITVNSEDFTINRTRDDIATTWEMDASANTDLYSIDNNLVVWNDGTILQYNGVDVLPTDYIENDAYTTRANDPTTGTVKFGSAAPTKYYLGNKAVDRIYMGTVLLYKKAIVYTITANLANCTANSDNPITIEENGGAILYYTANTGYELPDGVELTNVGSYNWDKATGKLVIARPSGNVTIKIVAKQTMTQLATPQNVSVENTTLSFDEVENAEEYEVFVDNTSIGSYQVSKGETWLLNDNLNTATALEKTEINFTSNNTQYTALQYKRGTLSYYTVDGSLIDIANPLPEPEGTSWVYPACKTITFDSPVTDSTLLTWLQANGVKQ